MKKLFLLFACTALLCGCKDDETPEGGGNPDPSLTLTVDAAKSQAVQLTVTPESDLTTYYAGAVKKETLETTHKNDLAAAVDAQLAQLAEEAGKTVPALLKELGKQGKSTVTVKGLTSGCDYAAFAVSMDADGKQLTQPVKEEFKTTDDFFTVTISDITPTTAELLFEPENDELVYFFNVLDKNTYAEHHDSDIATYINNLIAEQKLWEDKTVAEIVQEISSTGPQPYTAQRLTPDCDYLAFAVGLAEDGTLTTKPTIEEFRTPELVVDLTFESKVLKQEWDNIDFEVTPSDNELTYWFSLRPAAFCKDKTDAELLATVINDDSFIMPYMIYSGKTTIERLPGETPYTYYLSDTGYVLLVFGYDVDAGVATTGLSRFEMRTAKPAGDPATCTFAVNVSDLKARSANVDITPSDEQQTYVWELMTSESYESYKNRLNDYVADFVGQVGIDELENLRTMGPEGYNYTDMLVPNSTYYVWAVCLDENGKPKANVFVSEPFVTPAAVLSSATCTATLNKYFNGDEVYALDPATYADAKGYAYVSLTFEHNDDAKMWYGGIFSEDLTDPAEWSDEDIYSALNNWDYSFPTGVLRYCSWNTPCTVLAFAKDAAGEYGPVYRKGYTFTKAGAAPISEFEIPTGFGMSSVLKFVPAPKQQPIRFRTPEPNTKQ